MALVKRGQMFGCGHPPEWAGLMGGSCRPPWNPAPVCAGGPSLTHCHQSLVEGMFYVIMLTELDPSGFGKYWKPDPLV